MTLSEGWLLHLKYVTQFLLKTEVFYRGTGFNVTRMKYSISWFI